MRSISIGGDAPIEEIKKMIEESPFKKKVDIKFECYENRFIYYFTLEKRKLNEKPKIIIDVANFVEEVIFKFYINDLVETRVKRLLKDFDDINKEEIIKDVCELIQKDEIYIQERKYIQEEIFDYLIENRTLILDGYVKFRPKSFYYIIDLAIGEIVGNIETEMEYVEFLNMLQYYIDTQIPKMDLVHAIIQDGEFLLFDSNNNEIGKEFKDEIMEEIFYDDISESDILLSSLIVLAPLRIVIHIQNDKENELMTILGKIFGNRIEFCNGCSMCNLKGVIDSEKDRVD